jgi:hypothetical protein
MVNSITLPAGKDEDMIADSGQPSYAKSSDLSVVRDSTASRLHGDDVAAFAGDDSLDVRRPSIKRLLFFDFIFVLVVGADQLRR